MGHVEAGGKLASGETQVENLLEGLYSYLHLSTRLKFKTCPAGVQGWFRWDDALWSQPGTFLGARGRGLRKTDMASTPESITNQWETSRKRLIISTALL